MPSGPPCGPAGAQGLADGAGPVCDGWVGSDRVESSPEWAGRRSLVADRVLVVEDDETVRTLLRMLLEDDGLAVTGGAGGKGN